MRAKAVEAYIQGDYHPAQAVRILRRHISSSNFNSIKAPGKFAKAQYEKFMSTGSVADSYSKKRKQPELGAGDEVAQRAAKILKTGYWTTQELPVPGTKKAVKVVEVHTFWPSFRAAVQYSYKLQGLLAQAGVKAKTLLRRMHKVDMGLVRRTVHYKLAQDDETIQQRRETAAANLQRSIAEPDFLRRIVWIDETTIWLVNNKHMKRRVWCDSQDWDTHHVVRCPMLKKGKPVKLHIMCAVNYVLGPFFLEFTTGTKDIRRIWIDDKDYLVGASKQVHPIADLSTLQPLAALHIQAM